MFLTHQPAGCAILVGFFLLRGERFGDFGGLGEGYDVGVGVGGHLIICGRWCFDWS